jgi:acyl-CoA dehydrogenase
MRSDEDYQEIRSAVRALCSQIPDAYLRKVDAERGYPGELVAALTAAGWM